jgi:hypothetical protein
VSSRAGDPEPSSGAPARAHYHDDVRYLLSLLLAGIAVALPRFGALQPELFSAPGALANAWADVDGDGDLDLFVGFNGAPARLYVNEQGVFADGAAAAGLADARPTRAAAWGDYDGDGDADLLLGFAPGAGSVLRLHENRDGRFTDVTQLVGLNVDSAAVRQPSWIDVDGDGDLDLFVAFRDRANALFRNDGGRFTEIARETGLADPRRSVGAVWLDLDEDGDPDLVVGNMDGDANGVFRNDGGHFTDVAAELGLAWGGRAPDDASNGTVRPCAADVDADGRLDLFFANYGPNGLFLNRGSGRFEDVSRAWGVAIDGRYDTCAFADADHDGRPDLYVNGTVTGGVAYPDYLFRNTGAGFSDETPANIRALAASHGVQWADRDGDGDLDLALAGAARDASHPLLDNLLERGTATRSVSIDVRPAMGRTLPGAEVRVYRAGTRTLLGSALVDTGSGYNSQSLQPVHVGVADAALVDVEVTVPARGERRVSRVEAVPVSPGAPVVITVRIQ